MSTDQISGLVPEIYYDLIARVAAGATVVILIASPTWVQIQNSANATSFIALVGLGYLVGHLLTTISFMLNALIWNRVALRCARKFIRLNYSFRSNSIRDIFDRIYTRIDWVAKTDAGGGAILKKMEAGSALTDSLLSGWIVIMAYSAFMGPVAWGIQLGRSSNWFLIVIMTGFLWASVMVRRLLLIVRQDRILHLLNYDPSAVELQDGA